MIMARALCTCVLLQVLAAANTARILGITNEMGFVRSRGFVSFADGPRTAARAALPPSINISPPAKGQHAHAPNAIVAVHPTNGSIEVLKVFPDILDVDETAYDPANRCASTKSSQ